MGWRETTPPAHQRHQDGSTNEKAHRRKGHWPDGFHGRALHDKAGAPDDRHKQQHCISAEHSHGCG